MSNFIPLAWVINAEIYFFIRLNFKNSHLRLTEICMDLKFRRKKLMFDTLGLGLDMKLEAHNPVFAHCCVGTDALTYIGETLGL